jgi:hypothetical protein
MREAHLLGVTHHFSVHVESKEGVTPSANLPYDFLFEINQRPTVHGVVFVKKEKRLCLRAKHL